MTQQTISDVGANLTTDKAHIQEAISADIKKYTRIGWLILLGGFGCFLLWAMTAPLDKGVPLHGTVMVDSNKKAVQHETGGTVDEILVKDGEMVTAGQVLLRMNQIQATSEAGSVRSQYISARVLQTRLIAEQAGKSSFSIESALFDPEDKTIVDENIQIQQQIFQARRRALHNELLAIDANITGLNLEIKGLESAVENKRMQQAAIAEQAKNIRGLAKEGYVPSNRVLELDESLSRINAEISEHTGQIGQSRQQISRLNLQKQQRKQEYQNEISSQLSEAQNKASALQSQLLNLDRQVNNVDVKAPVSGVVVGLAVFTKGAVINPGFKILDIVPAEDTLVVEGKLPVHLIDKVYVGLPVNLMLTAYNQNKTPEVPAKVSQVSADSIVDEQSGASFYKVIAKVTPEGATLVKSLNVRPGMPVDLFIKTGERTMMNYLLKPLLDHLKLSMTEE